MRMLTAQEYDLLGECLDDGPCIDTQFCCPPDGRIRPGTHRAAAFEALRVRGLVKRTDCDADPMVEHIITTPLGELARRCYEAARFGAGLLSSSV